MGPCLQAADNSLQEGCPLFGVPCSLPGGAWGEGRGQGACRAGTDAGALVGWGCGGHRTLCLQGHPFPALKVPLRPQRWRVKI